MSLYAQSDHGHAFRPGEHRYLARGTLLRFGMHKFFAELNTHLDDGWHLVDLRVERWGLLGIRLVMFARLYRPPVPEE